MHHHPAFHLVAMMSEILGKRKRRKQTEVSNTEHLSDEPVDNSQHLQRLLREHFEARFEPLEDDDLVSEQQSASGDNAESEVSEEGWTGLSEDGEEANAIVVDCQSIKGIKADISKEELKLFMVLRQ